MSYWIGDWRQIALYWYGVPHKIIFASTGVVLGRLMGAFDYTKL